MSQKSSSRCAFTLVELPAVSGRKRPAFTLVELLVVIGIIAVLIGVLLPVLSRVQERGRNLKCQANMRQLLVALRGYAEESKGFLPYGFHYTRTRKPIPESQTASDVDEAGGNQGNFTCWASQITKWMRHGKNKSEFENDDDNFSEALICPEAQQAYPHVISYVVNMLVGVNPNDEFEAGSRPNAQVRPANLNKCLKDTVLIWDTAVFPYEENNVGYLSGVDIDGQRFWNGAGIPQYRYFSQSDPFAPFGQGLGNNDPVKMNTGSRVWFNIDPDAGPNGPSFPYQGNLRFRHQGNVACNGGFVDGHVEPFIAKLNADKSMKSHNALRRYFMIKYPTGVIPDPGNPS
jgi:prepilin-type N-terminal cleavage/methylation domain-containing protein/prepilin-type processing-associated H-X9-DG protein